MVNVHRNRAVFFDRDGVLVIPEFRDGRSFASTRIEDFEIYPDVCKSLEILKKAGYLLVVVTNQPDVGKGVIPQSVMDEMNSKLHEALPVDLIEVCPHTREANCDCRKPKPGMLHYAAEKLDIALDQSFMIGDRASDIEAGRAAGCKTIFIDLGYEAEIKPVDQDFSVSSVGEAVPCILNSAITKNGN